ncbi:MAG TPA: citrate transporter [Haliea salexigens]|uniref:Citrate transporter n=1 Tax=Haliea salexigens TaxID=287487 RepID=A0A3C1KIW5_9GAMM|nr:citrate transporter [Haliea sp.]HAN26555.1 citrate transporter [Haliea salexigens]|tara:strand:- start:1435 stop:2814 length:1380 start_codon:yes stop_codon:yes gene_type:complete
MSFSVFIGYAGLAIALSLLIWLALRGINIVFAALLSAAVVILSNGLPLAAGLGEYFAFGPLGAFTFAGKFFLLFAAGAMFGRVMGDSHAASSIALAMVRRLGPSRALWITVLATALLTYGGVVVFVVIFAMYPLGIKLLQQADIPKRLFCAALALGAGTFTLTALPGTPSIHNVISSVALGTDLFAGGWLGILASVIMFGLGMWYLESQRQRAAARGEGFVAGPRDRHIADDPGEENYPHWALALLPPVLVLSAILLPRVLSTVLGEGEGPGFALLAFANAQPVVWPSLALFAGTLVTVLMFAAVRRHALYSIGEGTQDSIIPLINTAAVIGFAGVVTQTQGFAQFNDIMLQSSLPPLISMFTSISVISAITGSASGGLQIFMSTMADSYLAMGIEPATLHRLATIAAGGFDSLPHSGAVVATLTITGLTHRDAYRDMGVVTVVIPVLATLTCMAVASL